MDIRNKQKHKTKKNKFSHEMNNNEQHFRINLNMRLWLEVYIHSTWL